MTKKNISLILIFFAGMILFLYMIYPKVTGLEKGVLENFPNPILLNEKPQSDKVNPMTNDLNQINFDNYIKEISKEIIDLTDSYVLLSSDKFNYLFGNMNLYVKDAIKVLSSPTFSEVEKHIVLFAVQGLELETFLSFSEKIFNLLEMEKVSHRIFSKTLFPPYNWNTKFPENFEKINVRKFLIKIRNSKSVEKNLKQYINHILSGKALKDIEEMRADGILPMLSLSDYLKTQ